MWEEATSFLRMMGYMASVHQIPKFVYVLTDYVRYTTLPYMVCIQSQAVTCCIHTYIAI